MSLRPASLIFTALVSLAFARPPARLVSPTPTPAPLIIAATPTPEPYQPTPQPTATPAAIVPEEEKPLIATPENKIALTQAGHDLVIEYEVGGRSGYNQHPEAPDARYSGVTWGIGYDAHQNSKAVILDDWKALGTITVQRLAATQPFFGRSAQAHLADVRSIIVAWQSATDVFDRIDVSREFSNAKRAMPGFEELRPNAQAALISLGFNRGWGMTGANRTEMRAIKNLVPKKDYAGIAGQLRVMVRVWRGTEIEKGMRRRRFAEAALVETP